MKIPFALRASLVLGLVIALVSSMVWTEPNVQAQQAAAEEAAAEPLDLTIPDGTPAEIDQFIQKLAEAEAEGDTEEAQIAHAKKVLGVILEAATRMQTKLKAEAEPNAEQVTLAHSYRLMSLQGLSQLGDEEAAKTFAAELEKAINDERPEIATIGWRSYLSEKLPVWDSLDDEAKEAVLAKIIDRVKSPHMSSLEVSIVQLVASNLDQVDDAFAVKLLEQALPVFEKSEAEDVKAALAEANMAGMLRRLNLPGNVMELEGDVLGGGTFDWKSYRGKVVLVDFSATWCGPCVAEAPNVLDMYNKYKDKGFDVVAVSLDRTPEAAESYVKENGIQWTTLFPKNEDDRYWNHPMVKHYGVTGIPTAILLDKDGKAVHMNARDEHLRDELQRLLGDPAESTAAAPGNEGAAG